MEKQYWICSNKIFFIRWDYYDNILLHLDRNQLNKKDLDVSIENANLDNL